MTRTFKKQLTQ